jgi:anti-sigma factor RsiW
VNGPCADPATLLEYWLGELHEAREEALERHYLGCEACSARLAEVEALGSGVRRAFAAGRVGAFLTSAFVERLRSSGLTIREYRVPRNGSVNCTVAPGDQVLLGRLEAPLDGVARVDAIVLHQGERRIEDVAFDAAAGEVIVAPSVVFMRTLPAHREVVRLMAVDAGGERLLGEYTFNHSPFQSPR